MRIGDGKNTSFLLSFFTLRPDNFSFEKKKMFLWNSDQIALVLQGRILPRIFCSPFSECRSLISSVLVCLASSLWPELLNIQKRRQRRGRKRIIILLVPYWDRSSFYLVNLWMNIWQPASGQSSDLILFACFPSDFHGILMEKCFLEDREVYKFHNYVNNLVIFKMNLH